MRFDSMEPMALLPEFASVLIAQLRADKVAEKPPEMMMLDESGNQAAAGSATTGGMLAVVPLWGVLSPDGGWGGTSLDSFARTMAMLDANPNVSKILINVTSPGGTVTGTPEAADAVRAVRDGGNTQIVAIANGMMASAAMWVGAAASEVVVTPSGEAGSIGVISMYADESAFLEKLGIKVDIMRTPEKKARFSGLEPMTDEMRSFVQERIGVSYEKFKRAMATNRGIRIDQVEAKFGGGEMMRAEEALAAGLVDRVATLDQTISRMMTRRAPSGARAALARAQLGKNLAS
jgi:signal peptide peptidase SppA